MAFREIDSSGGTVLITPTQVTYTKVTPTPLPTSPIKTSTTTYKTGGTILAQPVTTVKTTTPTPVVSQPSPTPITTTQFKQTINVSLNPLEQAVANAQQTQERTVAPPIPQSVPEPVKEPITITSPKTLIDFKFALGVPLNPLEQKISEISNAQRVTVRENAQAGFEPVRPTGKQTVTDYVSEQLGIIQGYRQGYIDQKKQVVTWMKEGLINIADVNKSIKENLAMLEGAGPDTIWQFEEGGQQFSTKEMVDYYKKLQSGLNVQQLRIVAGKMYSRNELTGEMEFKPQGGVMDLYNISRAERSLVKSEKELYDFSRQVDYPDISTVNIDETGRASVETDWKQVAEHVWGRDVTPEYTALHVGDWGLPALISGVGTATGLDKTAWQRMEQDYYRELAGIKRKEGESFAEYTGRFWTSERGITSLIDIGTLGLGYAIKPLMVGGRTALSASRVGFYASRFGEKFTSTFPKASSKLSSIGGKLSTGIGKTGWVLSQPIVKKIPKITAGAYIMGGVVAVPMVLGIAQDPSRYYMAIGKTGATIGQMTAGFVVGAKAFDITHRNYWAKGLRNELTTYDLEVEQAIRNYERTQLNKFEFGSPESRIDLSPIGPSMSMSKIADPRKIYGVHKALVDELGRPIASYSEPPLYAHVSEVDISTPLTIMDRGGRPVNVDVVSGEVKIGDSKQFGYGFSFPKEPKVVDEFLLAKSKNIGFLEQRRFPDFSLPKYETRDMGEGFGLITERVEGTGGKAIRTVEGFSPDMRDLSLLSRMEQQQRLVGDVKVIGPDSTEITLFSKPQPVIPMTSEGLYYPSSIARKSITESASILKTETGGGKILSGVKNLKTNIQFLKEAPTIEKTFGWTFSRQRIGTKMDISGLMKPSEYVAYLKDAGLLDVKITDLSKFAGYDSYSLSSLVPLNVEKTIGYSGKAKTVIGYEKDLLKTQKGIMYIDKDLSSSPVLQGLSKSFAKQPFSRSLLEQVYAKELVHIEAEKLKVFGLTDAQQLNIGMKAEFFTRRGIPVYTNAPYKTGYDFISGKWIETEAKMIPEWGSIDNYLTSVKRLKSPKVKESIGGGSMGFDTGGFAPLRTEQGLKLPGGSGMFTESALEKFPSMKNIGGIQKMYGKGRVTLSDLEAMEYGIQESSYWKAVSPRVRTSPITALTDSTLLKLGSIPIVGQAQLQALQQISIQKELPLSIERTLLEPIQKTDKVVINRLEKLPTQVIAQTQIDITRQGVTPVSGNALKQDILIDVSPVVAPVVSPTVIPIAPDTIAPTPNPRFRPIPPPDVVPPFIPPVPRLPGGYGERGYGGLMVVQEGYRFRKARIGLPFDIDILGVFKKKGKGKKGKKETFSFRV